jgi:hypothetical protein
LALSISKTRNFDVFEAVLGYEKAISSKFVFPGYRPVRNRWNAERL